MSDVAPNPTGQEEALLPIPPPSFSYIVLSLRAQAEMQLGIIRIDEDDKEPPDLQLARHAIDLLAVLQEKTKGNLTKDEHGLLEYTLTGLRLRFVQVSDDMAKASQKA